MKSLINIMMFFTLLIIYFILYIVGDLMYGFQMSLFSLILIIMINIVFFLKNKVKLYENTFYVIILISSFSFSLINTIIHIFSSTITVELANSEYIGLYIMANRIMGAILVLMSASLLLYNIYINSNKSLKEMNVKYYFIIITSLYLFLSLFFDLEIIKNGFTYNAKGDLTNYTYFYIGFLIIISLFYSVFNRGKKEIKHYSLYFIVFVCFLLMLLSYFFPEIMINDLICMFVVYIMFFTIENPDVKTIEKLTYANEQIEKANRAKTDFLSNMSHEIRTPLNAIIGFAHCIQEEEKISVIKEDATDIVYASETLLEIVNGVLDISKIEANKMEVVETNYDLVSEMEKVCKLIIPRIGNKDIKFNYKFAPDLPGTLYGDVNKLKQIITNLLTNAVKYTKEGSINFDISTINQANSASLIFTVSDSGRGIKDDQIGKLFTKFNRLDEDKNTTIEGTGLGLAITKSLIDLLGGKILVHSVYNEGSKFTVYIKQKIVDMNRINDVKSNLSANFDFANYKVLLVDDNKLNIKIAEKLLEKSGIKPDSVLSGLECIEKVKLKKYDLILLDDMMPEISGKETLNRLKQLENFDTPVVALTANVLSGNDVVYKNFGFNDYIGKPIDSSELTRILKKYYPAKIVLNKKRILLVDDNAVNNKIAKKILTNFNVDVDIVSSGSECLNKIYKENIKYDLIFMDDMMPEMSGVDTYNKLKEDSSFNIPVIMLTANAIDGSEDFYKSKGFDDYISKPIDMNKFKSIINKYIGE